jgi:6-phosphofructokinase 1
MENVRKNRDVSEAIAARDFDRAMDGRGSGFRSSFRVHRTMVRALPHPPAPGVRRLRLAVMNAGAPAPGMNTAARTAVRLGLDAGHSVLGVRNGFVGLSKGDLFDLDWMSVHGWVSQGGAGLGTNRKVPEGNEIDAIAEHLSRHQVEGLLVIGGWSAYVGAHALLSAREGHPALRIPIVCLPATIDNNLPGTELSIGADTALNSIIEAVDKIKQSAVATSRCFVVEVMGRYCGYLAMMSGLASGAERVYLHEKEPTLADLEADLGHLLQGFRHGKRLGLMIRNEKASSVFDTAFLRALFEKEGTGLFDAREAILGHLQQGGNPTPFDRIQATRLAASCVEWLVAEAERESPDAAFIGFSGGRVQFFPLAELPTMADMEFSRPKKQWWLDLEPIARLLAQPGPTSRP